MDPNELLAALAERKEAALEEAGKRYGPYIRKIAFEILHNEEDTKEVENDVLLKLWQQTERSLPKDLKAFLGMLSRQTAIDRLRTISAKRRGSLVYHEALEELAEVLPAEKESDPADALALHDALDAFLESLPRRARQLFLCRYWYAMSLKECADAFGMRLGAVKTALHRDRRKLKAFLEKEDITL